MVRALVESADPLGELLHVESSDLNMRLCKRMREAGCEFLEDQPKGMNLSATYR
jgi:hypothetical protein